MSKTGPESIRNIVLLSHSGAGKTSIDAAALLNAGAIGRLGRVDDGSTTSDYDPDEIKRKISISLSLLPCEWRDSKINIIDTPGHVDFTIEVERSLRVLDGACAVFCAVGGVEPQSETVWRQATKYHVPRLAFVNKMDRQGADFLRVVGQLKERLGANPIPMQLNIGAEEEFEGLVDLLSMKAIYWNEEDRGVTYESRDIPETLKAEAGELREQIIEAAAEANEELMEKYLDDGELSVEEIKLGIRLRTLANEIVPCFCGSAFKNKGVQAMLDAVVDYMPAPTDVPAIRGIADDKAESEVERQASDDEPFAALAFKIATDSFVGTLTFFRVYSGVVKTGDAVFNPVKGKKERFGRIVQMHANSREEIKEVRAGDIAAAVGLKDVTTGDTLCDPTKVVTLERMEFPEPVISVAIEPKTTVDQEKMGVALSKLAQEDPSFRVHTDQESGQTIISGMGELHLEIIVDRMKREFGVGANVGAPQVAYRETIRKTVKAEGKFIRQSGGKGQYGHVWLKLEPIVQGSGYEFVNEIVGGVVPTEYIGAIDKGIEEQLENGVLAGFPMVDVRVTLFDGSYHDVDSNEMAFKVAASMGLRNGGLEADPVLLEPIMKVEVVTPEDYMGDVMGDLNRRRGIVHGMEEGPAGKMINAEVPLAEMFGYATDLRSATQGRATYSMEFEKYAAAPSRVAVVVMNKK